MAIAVEKQQRSAYLSSKVWLEGADAERAWDGGPDCVCSKDRIEIMKWNSSNIERLVLGCMDSYDSEKRLIFQDFSRWSTRFLCLRTAKTSKFQLKIVKLFWRNELKFHFIPILADEFWSFSREILMDFFRISWILNRYSQKMMKCLEILIKTPRKMRKKAENSGIYAKFHSFI